MGMGTLINYYSAQISHDPSSSFPSLLGLEFIITFHPLMTRHHSDQERASSVQSTYPPEVCVTLFMHGESRLENEVLVLVG